MDVRNAGAARMRSIPLICLLIGLATTAVAQAGRGSISGLDTDQNGAIVPGGRFVTQSQATGVKLDTVSTAAGLYSFVSLTPDNDQITLMFFSTRVSKPLALAVKRRTTFEYSH